LCGTPFDRRDQPLSQERNVENVASVRFLPAASRSKSNVVNPASPSASATRVFLGLSRLDPLP
jgi:hypothetical protein